MAQKPMDALADQLNEIPAEIADLGAEGEQAQEASEPIDLDKVDTFIFQGQKYTPEELNKAILRQSDYSRKTQEVAQEKKFITNLSADLEYIRENPDQVENFKKVYPEHYHKYLDFVLAKDNSARPEDGVDDDYDLPPQIQERLKKLDKLEEIEAKLQRQEQKEYESQVAMAEKQIDNIFSKFQDKYPYAVEDVVLNRVQSLLDENRDNPGFQLTENTWERVFKAVNNHYQKHFESRYRNQAEAQLKDSERASDSAPGGMAPGRAPRRMSFEDATEAAIQDLSGRSR